MAQEKKYIPELRFPEFKSDGEWILETIGTIADTFSGGTPTVGNREYYGGYIPFIRSGEISNDKTELFITESGLSNSSARMVDKGTVLYAMYGATSGEVAISKISGAINQAILAIIPKSQKYNSRYIYHYLKHNKQYILGKYLQGGQGNLSANIINNLPIYFPCDSEGKVSIKEQQKIADCLSSLDEYIYVTKQKVDQLKEHKKGLTQCLFPYNGKTMPDIRFPEFYDEVAWIITKNDCVIKTITPPKKLSSSEYKVNGKYPIVDQSINFIAGYSDDETAVVHNEDNDYVVFGDHTCILKRVNFPFVQGADGVKIFTSKYSDLLTLYIYQYMCAHPIMSKEYKRHFSDLREQEFIYPKKMEEQEKIAQSLLSLDEIILAYENKVSTMERHKKALMQQLFPQL